MPLRICILGSGSIGTYYGAKLAHRGSDVHFLMRGDLSEVRRNGIFVRGEGENFHLPRINCYNSTKEIGPCDLVIIAVKATRRIPFLTANIRLSPSGTTETAAILDRRMDTLSTLVTVSNVDIFGIDLRGLKPPDQRICPPPR